MPVFGFRLPIIRRFLFQKIGDDKLPQPPTSYVDFEASCLAGILSVTVNGVNVDHITGSDCDNADVGLFGYAYDGTDTISFDYFQYGKFK